VCRVNPKIVAPIRISMEPIEKLPSWRMTLANPMLKYSIISDKYSVFAKLLSIQMGVPSSSDKPCVCRVYPKRVVSIRISMEPIDKILTALIWWWTFRVNLVLLETWFLGLLL
jgi:hypothetical protein